MKSICNIFKPIDKTNGNFLLFSQYINDISKSVIDSTYKVTPSRFICMNLNSGIQNNANSLTSISGDSPFDNQYTDYIPGFFQNNFENGVSVMKNNSIEVNSFNFTVALVEKLAELTKNINNVNLQSYITYIGDIDTCAWEDGFADILLSINSGSVKKVVELNPDILAGGDNISYSDFASQNCGLYSWSDGDAYISGWTTPSSGSGSGSGDDIPLSGVINTSGHIGNGNGTISGNSSWIEQIFNISDSEDMSFVFNTILILYDVYNTTSNQKIYTDVPLGIYFTGAGIEEGIGNPVTIYSQNDAAYGAGSGWALRICTKFTPTPFGGLKVDEVALDNIETTNSITKIISATAEAIKTVREFADKSIYTSQTIKDTLSQFKNSRTNVPYIRDVDGVKYWFINGRNTEVPVYQ